MIAINAILDIILLCAYLFGLWTIISVLFDTWMGTNEINVERALLGVGVLVLSKLAWYIKGK